MTEQQERMLRTLCQQVETMQHMILEIEQQIIHIQMSVVQLHAMRAPAPVEHPREVKPAEVDWRLVAGVSVAVALVAGVLYAVLKR